MEPDRPHHYHPATCVIAQQYSSPTFISLRLYLRKENFGARFKSVIISFF
jgi:hypothetical protein